jgi:hypothetical protein
MSLLAAPAVRGASQFEVTYRRIPQIGDQLCWAATAQSILEHAGIAVSQFKIVESLLKPQQSSQTINCQTTTGELNPACDIPNSPEYPLTTFLPQSNNAAGYYSWYDDAANDFDALKKRLDHGPLAFGLNYEFCKPGTGKNMVPCILDYGSHFLLAVGYSDGGTADTQWVSIYDPWKTKVGYPEPADGSETYHDFGNQNHISFAAYLGNGSDAGALQSDMGVPYSHMQDYWLGEVPHVPTDKLLTEWRPPTKDPIEIGRAVPMDRSILESNPFALTAITRYTNLHVRADGGNGSELRLGPPLPIMPIGIADLRNAGRSPARELLRPDTDRILYPVEQDGVVVDAFILTRVGERWMEGGYANTGIVRDLVELRARMGRACDADTCYLVSIPGLRVFLLARRTGTSATLVSVSDSVHVHIRAARSDVLKAGVSYRASRLMKALQSAARAQQPIRTAQAR